MTIAQYIAFGLLWIWQFPQNLCALILRLYYRRKTAVSVWDEQRMVWYVVVPRMYGGGVSLGNTIFVKRYFMDAMDDWAHEYGHSRQSRYLGPLYLFVIGIPSLVWCIWYIIKHPAKSYYRFYTEKWADKLGHVSRIR